MPVRVLPSLAQDLPDPRGGRSGGERVVSADDAAARRERDGLNDAGRADLGGEGGVRSRAARESPARCAKLRLSLEMIENCSPAKALREISSSRPAASASR